MRGLVSAILGVSVAAPSTAAWAQSGKSDVNDGSLGERYVGRQITLRPVSVEGSAGLNVAAGAVTLKPAPAR